MVFSCLNMNLYESFKNFFQQYYLMSRKIHKVQIALTNNDIDTTGAVSRDTISVELKNWKFRLSKESWSCNTFQTILFSEEDGDMIHTLKSKI